MAHQSRIAGAAGLIAAISMAFTPAQAQAAEIAPVAPGSALALLEQSADGHFDASRYDAEAETGEWRGRRYYPYRRHHRRHRGIDGGDVLAGVLILGGIAAIASAASNKNERRDDRRYDDRRYDDRRYDDRRTTNPRTSSDSGLDNAVNMCLAEIERDVRVDSVDGASRVASGWLVSGTLFNGSGFTCTIDNSGRISNVDYGGLAAAHNQWSDDRYADARARMGSRNYESGQDFAYNDAPANTGQLPAYPGGPLPGEE